MKLNWSKAFHGVQHAENLPKGHQITIEDRSDISGDDWATACRLNLHGNHPFTSAAEYSGTLAGAFIWAEKQAESCQ